MPYRYRKEERLQKKSEFAAAMKGKRLSADGLSLFYLPNGLGRFRVGISVGKKLGNAVARNRLRRRIRDSVGRVLRDHALGYDIVLVARSGLAGARYEQVLAAVTSVLGRSLLRPPRIVEGSSS